MAIEAISALSKVMPGITGIQQTEEQTPTVSFGQLLTEALNNVNQLEQDSNKITEDFIAGRTDNIHSVLIAGEKASISLQMVMEVRNKILDAYQEIMRMQV